jgi:hypothetical protein
MRTPRLAIALLLMTCAASGSTGEVSNEPTASIGGISLGDTQDRVRQLLGEPQQTHSTGDSLDPQFEYDGLTIWFWEGGAVAQLRSVNPKFCTRSGACPGMSVSDAEPKLGVPIQKSRIEEGRNDFVVCAEACWLQVMVSSGTVESLEIRCQP